MTAQWENRVCIITGAASGPGFAIADRLSAYKVKLALFDKDKDKLLIASGRLKHENEIYSLDIANEESVRAAVNETVKKFGKIDMLVNSAGITGTTHINSHEIPASDLPKIVLPPVLPLICRATELLIKMNLK
ncbi:MAG TPA: SDR family NAD(P)-dependent oxidoreductase [Agriterribacter sp.]|nr:SDR family NAD(P)-dependent oxidoreductase [Agriterribacter sp.]HRQ49308.1 SDR family NAD(P)-dependent oxidoreductase [Agriterribacter sp.]